MFQFRLRVRLKPLGLRFPWLRLQYRFHNAALRWGYALSTRMRRRWRVATRLPPRRTTPLLCTTTRRASVNFTERRCKSVCSRTSDSRQIIAISKPARARGPITKSFRSRNCMQRIPRRILTIPFLMDSEFMRRLAWDCIGLRTARSGNWRSKAG